MKLMESLPIVFVVAVAAAALAFDDAPAYERLPKVEAPKAEKRSLVARGPVVPAKAAASVPLPEPVEPIAAPADPDEPAVRKARAPIPAKREPIEAKPSMPRSKVEVAAPRPSRDERLRQAVMGAIERVPNLSGQIGVEARDAVVRLSGWTVTPGQSLRAEKAAARVDGVRRVVNEIRPRMGVITS